MIPAGSVVEVARGDSKGFRGVVLGQARSTYKGVPDLEVRFENGDVRWIGPDMLRVLAPAPVPSDDDVMSPLRRVRCP